MNGRDRDRDRDKEISELTHIMTNILTYSGIILHNIHYCDNTTITVAKEYFKFVEQQLKYLSDVSMNPIKEQNR